MVWCYALSREYLSHASGSHSDCWELSNNDGAGWSIVEDGMYGIGKHRSPMDINKLSWQVSY